MNMIRGNGGQFERERNISKYCMVYSGNFLFLRCPGVKFSLGYILVYRGDIYG